MANLCIFQLYMTSPALIFFDVPAKFSKNYLKIGGLRHVHVAVGVVRRGGGLVAVALVVGERNAELSRNGF